MQRDMSIIYILVLHWDKIVGLSPNTYSHVISSNMLDCNPYLLSTEGTIAVYLGNQMQCC